MVTITFSILSPVLLTIVLKKVSYIAVEKILYFFFFPCKALEFISSNSKEFNILRTRHINVIGAFHTQLMASAKKPLERAFKGMKLGTPKVSNSSWCFFLHLHIEGDDATLKP